MFPRKQQRDVDGHARENRLLDDRQTFLRSGNLDEQIGPPGAAVDVLAAASVAAVSWASSGETSNDVQPSTPLVLLWIGLKISAARVMSSHANSKKSASPDLPCLSFSRIAES